MTAMQIRYAPHAVDRMIEREISTAEVEEILNSPDGRIQQSSDKVIVYKRLNGRGDNSVAVVGVERNGNFEVVTAMVNLR